MQKCQDMLPGSLNETAADESHGDSDSKPLFMQFLVLSAAREYPVSVRDSACSMLKETRPGLCQSNNIFLRGAELPADTHTCIVFAGYLTPRIGLTASGSCSSFRKCRPAVVQTTFTSANSASRATSSGTLIVATLPDVSRCEAHAHATDSSNKEQA